jgi:hypothetical protein
MKVGLPAGPDHSEAVNGKFHMTGGGWKWAATAAT